MSINQIIIKEIENETRREFALFDPDDYLCTSYEVDDGSNVVGLNLISQGLTLIPSNLFRLNNLSLNKLDYIPEIQEVDESLFPSVEDLEAVLGPVRVLPVCIPHDCTDGFLCAYWRRSRAP